MESSACRCRRALSIGTEDAYAGGKHGRECIQHGGPSMWTRPGLPGVDDDASKKTDSESML